MPSPRNGALKEKLGLKHLERSVVLESTCLLVLNELFSVIKDDAFCFELCKASTGERAACAPPPAPLECPCDPHSGCSSVPPPARAFRKREGDICVMS